MMSPLVQMLAHVARRSGKVSRRPASRVPERVTRPAKVLRLSWRRHDALIKYRVQNRHTV